ncbi:TetR/AcrR family transcriptional regulator [Lichenicoccus sp.]|uniref:TetR/AcrR family transcriptional regulator n=1 Tax=Lichenicoccus sp. TaxID=2781899 RepID=UPI003D0D0424
MVEVLDKAAALFATRGFAATSLQDIANEIGLSRTSIYYYFSSKEALLEELLRGVTQRPTTIFSELGGLKGASHSARLTEAARQLVMWVTDPHTHFKLLDNAESELPKKLAAAHRDTKRRVLRGMVDLIQGGITDGEFRPVDAQVAAFAILGMCNWAAWWFSPSGKLSRKEVADQIAALALATVQKPAGTGTARDMKSLVASIRENLDLIDLNLST